MSTCVKCDKILVGDRQIKFCSTSCAASYNNKGKQKNRPKERTCTKCGEAFFNNEGRRRRLCMTCADVMDNANTMQNRTLGEVHAMLYAKGKHASWRNAYIRDACRRMNRHLDGHPCQKCDYKVHTEMCHIKPVSGFGEDAILRDINSESNIVVLCRNHHWEFDHGFLFLNELKPRS